MSTNSSQRHGPLVCVIIPVHNHAAALGRSLATLRAQTFRPLEAIIVDDGSTDHLDAVVAEYREQNERAGIPTKVIRQENAGAAAARNRGLREAAAEYTLFWDADTLAEPQCIERLAATLDSHPEASFAFCRFYFGFKLMRSQQFSVEDLKKYNYVDTTSLVRRADFPGFDEKLQRFQDWDAWLTMVERGKTGIFIPEILFRKMITRAGMSNWVPSWAYKLPWKSAAVREYERARQEIARKHQLPGY